MATELKGSTCKEKWLFEYKSSSKSIFAFSFAGREIFESEGTELGILKETQGICKAIRPHFSEKTNYCSVDSETVLPFGSEPRIRRKCEQAGNHFRITTDVSVFSKIAMKSLSVDSLKIKGDWKEIDIYIQKSFGSQEICKESLAIDKLSGKGISFSIVPIAVVFKDEAGIELEIGVGYDIWRWNNAERFNAKSAFSIRKQNDYIIFERKALIWESEYEASKFNFRYTWYFSWIKSDSKTADKKGSARRKTETLQIKNNKLIPENNEYTSLANISIGQSSWPETASVSGLNVPCFASRQTENLFKDFIRSTLFNNIKDREKNLTLKDVEPHICFKASHLERASQSVFIHWDYFYIMAFWEWANKYLSGAEKNFHIAVKSDSIFAELPSAKGLERF